MSNVQRNAPNEAASHPWERVGLGTAPYRYRGCFEDRCGGPVTVGGIEIQNGTPGQPAGTCDYCGQGIAICHKIRGADGLEFIVGSDCVARLDGADTRIERAAADAARKVALAASHARDDRTIAAGTAALEDPAVRAALAAATNGQRSMLDYVAWCLGPTSLCGRAGKVKAARIVLGARRAL